MPLPGCRLEGVRCLEEYDEASCDVVRDVRHELPAVYPRKKGPGSRKRFPMTLRVSIVLGLVALSLASGCRSLSGHRDAADRDPALPGPEASQPLKPAIGDKQVIRPGTLLRLLVMVADKREVDVETICVSEDGKLFLPLLREVRLVGMAFDEATAVLTASYAKFFIKPDVYLHRIPGAEPGDSGAHGFVTVTGRVKQPGLVPVPAALDLTVSQAILKSGGFITSAKDRSVRVARRQPDGTIEQVIVDLRSILAGGELDRDMVLKAGDVIYVPESLF